MTIEEYKKKLVSIVQDMENEHGFDVESVLIQNHSYSRDLGVKKFDVEIRG